MSGIWKNIVVAISFSFTAFLIGEDSCADSKVDRWFKISTDALDPGAVLELDMSRGYSYTEGNLIFIIVKIAGTEESLVVAFPNGGYWSAPKEDDFLNALDKEFETLERYLRKDSTEIKKE